MLGERRRHSRGGRLLQPEGFIPRGASRGTTGYVSERRVVESSGSVTRGARATIRATVCPRFAAGELLVSRHVPQRLVWCALRASARRERERVVWSAIPTSLGPSRHARLVTLRFAPRRRGPIQAGKGSSTGEHGYDSTVTSSAALFDVEQARRQESTGGVTQRGLGSLPSGFLLATPPGLMTVIGARCDCFNSRRNGGVNDRLPPPRRSLP